MVNIILLNVCICQMLLRKLFYGIKFNQGFMKIFRKEEKKASLRSQDGGFTPQLDNTHQICEDSKS